MIPAPEDVLTIKSASLLEHKLQFVLHAQKHATQIHVNDGVPGLNCFFGGRVCILLLNSSIVES
jgi:hypothetical protein